MAYFLLFWASGLLSHYHEAQEVKAFLPGLLNSLVSGLKAFRDLNRESSAVLTCREASKGSTMGPQYGPLPSLKASELRAPIL